jgi:hypothetical protein
MQAAMQVVCDRVPAAIRRIVKDDHAPRQPDVVEARSIADRLADDVCSSA